MTPSSIRHVKMLIQVKWWVLVALLVLLVAFIWAARAERIGKYSGLQNHVEAIVTEIQSDSTQVSFQMHYMFL